MNPMDLWLASGAWKPMPATFPMVLGADGAGIVEKLGEGTSRYSGGEHVFGRLLVAPLGSAGTYAEYVAVSEDAPLARVPSGLDDVVAAALPTAGGAGVPPVGQPHPPPRQKGPRVRPGRGLRALPLPVPGEPRGDRSPQLSPP